MNAQLCVVKTSAEIKQNGLLISKFQGFGNINNAFNGSTCRLGLEMRKRRRMVDGSGDRLGSDESLLQVCACIYLSRVHRLMLRERERSSPAKNSRF